jgi:hypothetical protein
MTSSSPAEGIAGFLGEHAATALEQWAAHHGKNVELAFPPWTASGYTGSKLAAIQISSRHPEGSQPEKVVVKVCPPGPYAREAERHTAALKVSPPHFVERHLVSMPYGPYPTGDGGLLIFQSIAGGSLLRSKPISALPEAERTDACVAVIRSILNDWNGGDFKISKEPVPVSVYLRNELRDAFAAEGSVRRWASAALLLDPGIRWISTAEDGPGRPLVNPVLMAVDEWMSPAQRLTFIAGRTHGDLHHENALIPRSPDGMLKPDDFLLVDLSTFDSNAPLSRDPTMLTLSIISGDVASLPAEQGNSLIDYLIKSEPRAKASLTPLMLRTVDAIRGAVEVSAFYARGFSDNWPVQYLLSLQATGLLFTTFDILPVKARWWFFRLAARAATHLLSTQGQLKTQPPRLVDQSILEATHLTSTTRVPVTTQQSTSAVPGLKPMASERSESTAYETEHPSVSRNIASSTQRGSPAQADNRNSSQTTASADQGDDAQALPVSAGKTILDTDLLPSTTVAHSGLSYSEQTKELISAALENDWHVVARLIEAAPTVRDGWSLWDWMESNRKLHRLRGALVTLRRYELVALLDADVTEFVTTAPGADELAAFRQASESLVGKAYDLREGIRHATAATSPDELVALATRPRHLANELQQIIAALPSLDQSRRYTLRWRLAWDEANGSADVALRQLLDILPATTEAGRKAFRRKSSLLTQAENTKAAFVSLHTLLQQSHPR